MEIIFRGRNRIIIGEHLDGLITIMVALSNGTFQKFMIPDSIANIISKWLIDTTENNRIENTEDENYDALDERRIRYP